MPAPIIGLTAYGRGEEQRFDLPAEYVDAVRRAGGVAVLLPPGEAQPRAWLAALDGLVLAGGGDLDPRSWDGPGWRPPTESMPIATPTSSSSPWRPSRTRYRLCASAEACRS